jgi:hypothetical protein
MALPIARNPENDIVKSDTLGSTTVAGVGAFIVGGTGAVVAFLDAIKAADVEVEVLVAGIGLMGLAVLGWSIATAGDALARAYATAHVTPGTEKPALAQAIEDVSFGVKSELKNGDKQPAIAEAIKALATSYENASFGVKSELKDGDKHPALAEAIKALGKSVEASGLPHTDRRDYLLHVPPGIRITLDGTDSQVLAVHYTPAKSELDLLVVGDDGELHFTEPTPIKSTSGLP